VIDRRGRRGLVPVAAVLVVLSAIWGRVNKPIEGTVLETVSQRHGLTLADMIVLPCLAIAAGLLWVARREHRAARSAGHLAEQRTPSEPAPRLGADTRES
jgi:hypothetical protein